MSVFNSGLALSASAVAECCDERISTTGRSAKRRHSNGVSRNARRKLTNARSSLKRRLPLVLSGVLCLALIGVCIGAYVQLRRQLAASAGDRVLAASRQIADMLDGQV